MWWRSSRSTTRRRTRAWWWRAISRRRRRRKLIEKWFGDVKPAAAPEPMTIPGVELKGVQKKTITDRVQLPRLYLAWLTPRHFEPGDAALDMVADVLAGGKNSRLFKRLVYDMQIAQDVSAFAAVAGAVVVVPDRRHAAARAHRGRIAEGDRRGDPEAAARAAHGARARTLGEPDRIVVLQPDGARRRLRRQGRSAERLLHRRPAIPTGSTRISRATARCRSATSRAAAAQFLPLDKRVELTVEPEKKP